MAKRPGAAVRGSTTGRPIMVLLDVLGERWTLRILWELRGTRLTFRALQERCDGVSPTVLNRRLKTLREMKLADHNDAGYGLTKMGAQLGMQIARMDRWSHKWAKELEAVQGEQN
jgi:DNA-binding HxlR family transcriptional regulator